MRLRQQVVPGVHATSRGGSRASRHRWRRSDGRSSHRRRSPTAARATGRDRIEQLPGGFPLRHSGPAPAPRSPDRPKVAVIAWDVGHNPLGRAHCLAEILARRFDVEIWGTQFERYGDRIWAPLEKPEIPIHSFDGRSFPQHLERDGGGGRAHRRRRDLDLEAAVPVARARRARQAVPRPAAGARRRRPRALVLRRRRRARPRRAAQAVGERPRAPVRTGVDPCVRAGDHELRPPDGVERRAGGALRRHDRAARARRATLRPGALRP